MGIHQQMVIWPTTERTAEHTWCVDWFKRQNNSCWTLLNYNGRWHAIQCNICWTHVELWIWCNICCCLKTGYLENPKSSHGWSWISCNLKKTHWRFRTPKKMYVFRRVETCRNYKKHVETRELRSVSSTSWPTFPKNRLARWPRTQRTISCSGGRLGKPEVSHQWGHKHERFIRIIQ